MMMMMMRESEWIK